MEFRDSARSDEKKGARQRSQEGRERENYWGKAAVTTDLCIGDVWLTNE